MARADIIHIELTLGSLRSGVMRCHEPMMALIRRHQIASGGLRCLQSQHQALLDFSHRPTPFGGEPRDPHAHAVARSVPERSTSITPADRTACDQRCGQQGTPSASMPTASLSRQTVSRHTLSRHTLSRHAHSCHHPQQPSRARRRARRCHEAAAVRQQATRRVAWRQAHQASHAAPRRPHLSMARKRSMSLSTLSPLIPTMTSPSTT